MVKWIRGNNKKLKKCLVQIIFLSKRRRKFLDALYSHFRLKHRSNNANWFPASSSWNFVALNGKKSEIEHKTYLTVTKKMLGCWSHPAPKKKRLGSWYSRSCLEAVPSLESSPFTACVIPNHPLRGCTTRGNEGKAGGIWHITSLSTPPQVLMRGRGIAAPACAGRPHHPRGRHHTDPPPAAGGLGPPPSGSGRWLCT